MSESFRETMRLLSLLDGDTDMSADYRIVQMQVDHNSRTAWTCIKDMLDAYTCDPEAHRCVAANAAEIKETMLMVNALWACINRASTTPEIIDAAE